MSSQDENKIQVNASQISQSSTCAEKENKSAKTPGYRGSLDYWLIRPAGELKEENANGENTEDGDNVTDKENQDKASEGDGNRKEEEKSKEDEKSNNEDKLTKKTGEDEHGKVHKATRKKAGKSLHKNDNKQQGSRQLISDSDISNVSQKPPPAKRSRKSKVSPADQPLPKQVRRPTHADLGSDLKSLHRTGSESEPSTDVLRAPYRGGSKVDHSRPFSTGTGIAPCSEFKQNGGKTIWPGLLMPRQLQKPFSSAESKGELQSEVCRTETSNEDGKMSNTNSVVQAEDCNMTEKSPGSEKVGTDCSRDQTVERTDSEATLPRSGRRASPRNGQGIFLPPNAFGDTFQRVGTDTGFSGDGTAKTCCSSASRSKSHQHNLQREINRIRRSQVDTESPPSRAARRRPLARSSAVDLRMEEDDTFKTPRPVKQLARRTVAADGTDALVPNASDGPQSKRLNFETPKNASDLSATVGYVGEIGSIFNRSTFSRPTASRMLISSRSGRTPAVKGADPGKPGSEALSFAAAEKMSEKSKPTALRKKRKRNSGADPQAQLEERATEEEGGRESEASLSIKDMPELKRKRSSAGSENKLISGNNKGVRKHGEETTLMGIEPNDTNVLRNDQTTEGVKAEIILENSSRNSSWGVTSSTNGLGILGDGSKASPKCFDYSVNVRGEEDDASARAVVCNSSPVVRIIPNSQEPAVQKMADE